MKFRPAVALVLLLTFPASTLAQAVPAAPETNRPAAPEPTSRLNLKAPARLPVLPKNQPVVIRVPTARPRDFEQAAPQQSCAESEARGRTDADAKPMSKPWFFGGMGSGVAFGVYGIGITAISAAVKPKPKTVPAGLDAACYTQGFGSKRRHENTLAALWGSLIGVAAWVAILVAVNYDDWD